VADGRGGGFGRPGAQYGPGRVEHQHHLQRPAAGELGTGPWGRLARSLEAGAAAAQASAADLESATLSAQATLAADYFLLRTADAEQQLLDRTVAAYERSLQLVQNRFAQGVASRADVVQAETQLEGARAQAIDVGVQRAQLEHAIAVLCGEPPAELSIAPAVLQAAMPTLPVGLPSELIERRPDIAAAERRVAAANASIGVAAAAQAAFDVEVASYRQTVLAAFAEVEDQVAALRILEQEAVVQERAVQVARQSLAIAENQCKAGTISYLEVVVVQAVALGSERTAMDIRGRQLSACVALIRALGGLGREPAGADRRRGPVITPRGCGAPQRAARRCRAACRTPRAPRWRGRARAPTRRRTR
jgi:outer membrane protein TolC